MATNYHMHLSVRGALVNWSDRAFKGVFSHDDGRPMTAREAKATLRYELNKGHEIIPAQGCDNFDYTKGCLGHAVEPVASATGDNDSPTPQVLSPST